MTGLGLAELTAALRDVRDRFDLEAVSAVVDVGGQRMAVTVGRGPELVITNEAGDLLVGRGAG
jgi:hypothetical protein